MLSAADTVLLHKAIAQSVLDACSLQSMQRAVDDAAYVVDSAIAAVDADGDGNISLEEAMNAPSAIADWWAGLGGDFSRRGRQ